jgi:hypothetical protein
MVPGFSARYLFHSLNMACISNKDNGSKGFVFNGLRIFNQPSFVSKPYNIRKNGKIQV